AGLHKKFRNPLSRAAVLRYNKGRANFLGGTIHMKIETLAIHGASLTVYLRDAEEVMPMAQARPLVLVVPGGGYSHVSPREGDPVAVRFLAAGYHAAVLRYGVGEQAQN